MKNSLELELQLKIKRVNFYIDPGQPLSDSQTIRLSNRSVHSRPQTVSLKQNL
jgi:hypothetical protein